jgi:hypothetical protein
VSQKWEYWHLVEEPAQLPFTHGASVAYRLVNVWHITFISRRLRPVSASQIGGINRCIPSCQFLAVFECVFPWAGHGANYYVWGRGSWRGIPVEKMVLRPSGKMHRTFELRGKCWESPNYCKGKSPDERGAGAALVIQCTSNSRAVPTPLNFFLSG